MTWFLRFAFIAMAGSVLVLALTPGPLGEVIESGEHRHILAFSILPLASALIWPRTSYRLQFLGYALFGAAIEVAQGVMAVGRAAELDDWLIDCAAAAVVLGLVAIVRATRTPAARPAG